MKIVITSLILSMSALCLTGCAAEPMPKTDANGIPQTRDNLTDAEQQQLNTFLAKQKANMRFVEGGSFEMGDFGHKLDWTEGLPLLGYADNKPLHKVTLDSFSMNAYKATYGDFDIYSMATGQPKEGAQEYNMGLRKPNVAAGINWQSAQQYCQWLGQQLGVPMDLPTEAQWEYAARNRGQYIAYPTDNGEIDAGRNVWTYKQMKKVRANYDTSLTVPVVGLYPPNPLGLYDMINQNYEWMLDWYDAEYYANSPEHNPQGPKTGTEKVVRSVDANEGTARNIGIVVTVNISRSKRDPNPPLRNNSTKSNQNNATSARCVANSTQPLI